MRIVFLVDEQKVKGTLIFPRVVKNDILSALTTKKWKLVFIEILSGWYNETNDDNRGIN